MTQLSIQERLAQDPVIQDLLRDIEHHRQQDELRKARADPKAHRLSKLIADGKSSNWRYCNAGKDSRGRRIRFCYSCWKNVAGYYLFWREVVTRDRITRDSFASRRTRRECAALARRRAQQFKAEQAG